MRLLLIRHGESVHSKAGLVAGEHGCPGLTERGREQAAALRRRLKGDGLRANVLLSSPVARARETALILAPALPTAGAVRFDRNLCEPDPGEGDGLTAEEFVRRYGSVDPLANPGRPLSPGGESWDDFIGRIRATMSALPGIYPGQTVVAVTHSGFITWTFLTLFGIPRPGTGARVDPDFTSITLWEYHETSRRWWLRCYNDTSHLAGGA